MPDPISFRIKKKIDRYIQDPILAFLVLPFLIFLKVMPYKLSSYLCGYFIKIIAPFTKYQKRVMKNLKIAFPEKSISELYEISKNQWFNFGQIIGEYPHTNKMINLNRVETIGLNKIKKGPAILVGAHIGNWEFTPKIAQLAGRRAGYVFRPINNWILNMVLLQKNKSINADFFKKGRLAAIGLSNKLKNNEIIGLLNDQLLREGIMVPFFGKKTPTSRTAALMCLKWNVPIYMVRVERFDGTSFRMTIEDKLKIPKSKTHDKKIYEITKLISKRIEEWIIEHPEQWLWAHRRWGK